jgi:simple sugar transport system permease protein
MTISGALAGLAGMIQMMGVAGRLQAGLSPGFGFTGIVVALIGRNRPVGVLLGALFMAGLVTGGQSMAVTEQVPFGIVLTIQGLFVVFLLVADRLARRSGKAGA